MGERDSGSITFEELRNTHVAGSFDLSSSVRGTSVKGTFDLKVCPME